MKPKETSLTKFRHSIHGIEFALFTYAYNFNKSNIMIDHMQSQLGKLYFELFR